MGYLFVYVVCVFAMLAVVTTKPETWFGFSRFQRIAMIVAAPIVVVLGVIRGLYKTLRDAIA